ncbi:hypothetical protein [Nonlabens xiamenensis]|uniref:hypothetical protein n=1 Tax=Nonlabens xiamenensis TaxID=2341043 RepID=UPI000F606E3F|nr:hypothetical protein [Nonlabens xiamenensis]
MKLNLLFGLTLFLALFACKQSEPDTDPQLQEQIQQFESIRNKANEVHDQLMSKMSEISALRKALNDNITDQNKEVYTGAITELKEAHDGMMEWMQDYNKKFPYEYKNPTTKAALDKDTPILAQEVDEIVDLKEQTLDAIENAKQLLKE